jgi:PleD family two-component response regulator
MAEKTHLSSTEVSALLMVSPLTVCEWVHKGMLHARLRDGEQPCFAMEDIQRFARKQGLTLHGADNGKLSILVVDDDLRFAQFLVSLFATFSETMEAVAVHSGFDAGRQLSELLPDVVLLNMAMAHQQGFEICRRLKSEADTRHLRVIALMDDDDVATKQRSLMAGADACLAKPLDNQVLFETLGLQLNFSDNLAQPVG